MTMLAIGILVVLLLIIPGCFATSATNGVPVHFAKHSRRCLGDSKPLPVFGNANIAAPIWAREDVAQGSHSFLHDSVVIPVSQNTVVFLIVPFDNALINSWMLVIVGIIIYGVRFHTRLCYEGLQGRHACLQPARQHRPRGWLW